MKKSHIIVLTFLLLSLIGIYFYNKSPKQNAQPSIFTTIVPNFNIDEVDDIKVGIDGDKKDMPLHIIKKQGDFLIEVSGKEDADSGNAERSQNSLSSSTFFAPCNANKVKKFLSYLRGLKGEERAKGKAHFDTFNLADDTSLLMEATGGGKTVFSILVGKRGKEWNTSFIRIKGKDSIYIVRKNLLSLVDIWDEAPKKNPSYNQWIDLSVISETSEQIEAITYATAKEVWGVRLTTPEVATVSNKVDDEQGSDKNRDALQKKWIFTKDGMEKEIDPKDAISFLSSILPLYAEGVSNPKYLDKYGLSSKDTFARLTVHIKNKGIKLFHIGRIDEKKGYGWLRDKRGNIYKIKADTMKKLITGPTASPDASGNKMNSDKDKGLDRALSGEDKKQPHNKE